MPSGYIGNYVYYYKLEDSSVAFIQEHNNQEMYGDSLYYFDIIYENKKYVVAYDNTNDEIIIREGNNENMPNDDIFKRLINAHWWYWTPDYRYICLNIEHYSNDNNIYLTFNSTYPGGGN